MGLLPLEKEPVVAIEGRLPRALGLSRAALARAAVFFARRSAARGGTPFRAVSVVLQDDAFSEEVHLAVNGALGATDVVTQPYDPMPGEEPGIYGELYVNAERALAAAPRRAGWSPAKELLLYVAHGMDHLSGEDDLDAAGYARMRRRELRWLRDYFASLI
jgi:ssRNA-specific RNase YbeY (16S rRNA maturation enzyme)